MVFTNSGMAMPMGQNIGGARVLKWFDAILRSYDLGLAKFLGPAYAARETDAFSKHVAMPVTSK